MKIDNLQIPKAYTQTKTSNNQETKEDFSKVLLGQINSNKANNVKEEEGTDKIVNYNMIDIEVDEDVENAEESINTLLVFMTMPQFEEHTADITDVAGEQFMELNYDSSISLNLLNLDNINLQNNYYDSSVSEDLVLENIIRPEILAVNQKPENNEIISFDDKILSDEANLDIKNSSRLQGLAKQQTGDKSIVLDNEFSSVDEMKALNVDELINIENLDLKDIFDDEVLNIKKEEPIEDNKWLNHNIQTSQKVNVTNNIVQEAKVISNENIQNINDSIIQLMETATEGNTNVMKVQLYPEELGAVNITLKMEGGKLIAKIFVEDDYVKQLFTGRIEQLNNNLIKQNINMEEIFVELNSNFNPNSESGQNNSNFSNQNRNYKFDVESIDPIVSEEIILKSGQLNILA